MDNFKKMENIFLYSIVGFAILVLALFTRAIAISLGADGFTSLFAFIGAIIFSISLLFMLKILIHGVWVMFFRDKNNKLLKKSSSNDSLINQQPKEEKKTEIKEIEKKEEKEKEEEKEEIISNISTNQLDTLKGVEKIIEKKEKEKKLEQQKKLEIAIQYTKEQFATHVSGDDLISLCENIKSYSIQKDLDKVIPIKTKDLSTLDILHFGWNIWQHFDTTINQKIMINFLRKVFADSLEDISNITISKNLTKDERKGIIKLERKGLFQS